MLGWGDAEGGLEEVEVLLFVLNVGRGREGQRMYEET